MPSPFIGLTRPAASPIASQPGPWRRCVDIGSRHARGPSRFGPSSQSSRTWCRYDSSRVLRLSFLKPFIVRQGADADVDGAVARREHPAVARDGGAVLVLHATGTPRGGRRRGAGSPRSVRIARPNGSSGTRSAPSIRATAPWAPGGDDREVGADRPTVGDDAGDPAALDDRLGLGARTRTSAPASAAASIRCGIEPTTRPDGTVVGEPVGGRPVEFADLLPGDHPQSVGSDGRRRAGSSARRARRPRGASSPSPHTLSRPCAPFSNITTRAPPRAARMAAAAPAGPAPMIAMSTRSDCTAPRCRKSDGKARSGGARHPVRAVPDVPDRISRVVGTPAPCGRDTSPLHHGHDRNNQQRTNDTNRDNR